MFALFFGGDLKDMHKRKRKWAMPELSICPFYIARPEDWRGRWKLFFENEAPLQLELGCGKGVSTEQMLYENKNENFIAIDLISDVLADARRNISARYGDEPVRNAALTAFDIMNIGWYFAPEDVVERIHISFCNPWSAKARHEKRRLTHPRQLLQYRAFLQENGEIWFKTDDDRLFEDSIGYFKECGFEITYITRDLHAVGFVPNYLTEHEIRYVAKEIPIKFLIAKKMTNVKEMRS